MKDLYLIGAGGFSTEILHLVEIIQKEKKQWNQVFFIDDNPQIQNTELRGVKVLAGSDFLMTIDSEIDIVITINNVNTREIIINKLKENNKVCFPNLFSPHAIVDYDYIKIGEGNIVMHHVILSTNLEIGSFNIFNSYTGIGHDCKIGDINSFGPRVAISGAVTIGDKNDFGVNSIVLQNKNIGNNNNIWMNTSIMRNLKDGNTYFGIPAKKINL
ncbi:serine acetyltransferase [Chryseobacterium wangxinyae]|uniref:PglD-related sugar-binding protein n=1 Tax=Chryseobacterium sp. CY350 TaxID=2997336 RepID=UPI00226D670A|nr:serine acetyltransferase [Chryseobacterium sp. CY350]MCY0979385.1 serine acetyltransferase [Chryseobacterium sp. CY350]WBZ97119.1 serine acetyltransferase [Chryseobacterium sp. CY350]